MRQEVRRDQRAGLRILGGKSPAHVTRCPLCVYCKTEQSYAAQRQRSEGEQVLGMTLQAQLALPSPRADVGRRLLNSPPFHLETGSGSGFGCLEVVESAAPF